jgi:GT2 family glycosyltransferase
VAAVQPKILSFPNPRYFDHAGAGGGFLDNIGYPFCRGRIFETLEIDTGQYDDIIPVHWASGACMVVKAEDFHGVGGFDDRFFAHMEEIDLCWKWRLMGKKIFFHGGVEVRHVGGATLDKSNPQKTFLNFRNSLLMLHNNLPKGKFIWKYLIRVLLDLLASLVFLFQGNSKHSFAIIRAHRDFFRLKSLQKRTALAPDLSKDESKVKVKSILWEYYIKGKKTYFKI